MIICPHDTSPRTSCARPACPACTSSLERQVRISAGTFVALGSLAALLISPLWAALPAVIGSGLVFAGITNTCAMGMLLAKLLSNRAASCDTESMVRRFVAPDKVGLP